MPPRNDGHPITSGSRVCQPRQMTPFALRARAHLRFGTGTLEPQIRLKRWFWCVTTGTRLQENARIERTDRTHGSNARIERTDGTHTPPAAMEMAMITGMHAVIYTRNAEADRAFFKDVLGFSAVDAGGGWLIFAAPPSEIACHPAESNG